MKIYSWNQLWSGLLCGGLLIWWGTQAYSETPALALTQFSLAALLLARGLWCALTKRGSQWGQEHDRINKMALERRFGRYGNLALPGGIVLLLVFMSLGCVWPSFFLFCIPLLLFVALYYAAVFAMLKIAKDEIRAEEALLSQKEDG